VQRGGVSLLSVGERLGGRGQRRGGGEHHQARAARVAPAGALAAFLPP
jgi:hypothetical protein